MKGLILRVITILTNLWHRISCPKNSITFLEATLNCKIRINGTGNIIKIRSRSRNISISITGNNNRITIEGGKLLDSGFTIKGSNHICEIGTHRDIKNTTFIQLKGGTKIEIGNNIGIGGARLVVEGPGKVIKIGSGSMIADNVEIWASDTHPIFRKSDGVRVNDSGSVVIAENVWIGTGAFLLKNITIGAGSVIGAQAVVTKNVEEGSLVAGNPAKTIKSGIFWEIFD
jgi:acetyltransferase-like isoleucine patch superfamily enzyme